MSRPGMECRPDELIEPFEVAKASRKPIAIGDPAGDVPALPERPVRAQVLRDVDHDSDDDSDDDAEH